MESLIHQEGPIVYLVSNKFVNFPTVLQYEETPLIQVFHVAKACPAAAEEVNTKQQLKMKSTEKAQDVPFA